MLWSSACEYAIRATTHLAEHPDALVSLKSIAEAERVPAPFVAKILQSLVRAGILRSVKGPGGGYALARPADAISMLDVKAAVEGTRDLEACLAGLGRCASDVPCPLHEAFEPVRDAIRSYLAGTTIAQARAALGRKRAALRRSSSAGSRPGTPGRQGARRRNGGRVLHSS
jgi:Rrf2 family protein